MGTVKLLIWTSILHYIMHVVFMVSMKSQFGLKLMYFKEYYSNLIAQMTILC